MKRPTDAHVYEVFERLETERVTAGKQDTGESIIRTAEALGITYAHVQRVVVHRLCLGMGS